MRHAATIPDLCTATFAFLRSFGFRRCFLLSPVAQDARNGRILLNSGFNPIWERAYRRGLHLIDPIPGMALKGSEPFWWGDLAGHPDLDDRQQRYLKLIARFGMADGLAVPVFGPGLRCGLQGCGLEPGQPRLADDQVLLLRMGSAVSYGRSCDLIAADLEEGPPLSNREMDVLFWITRGKSNAVIADILGISAPTVDTYLRRIFAKLHVMDRTAAAVMAVQRGLFVTGQYGSPPSEPALPA